MGVCWITTLEDSSDTRYLPLYRSAGTWPVLEANLKSLEGRER